MFIGHIKNYWTMKEYNKNRKDVVYRVDSEKLVVKAYRLTDKSNQFSSTFEDFNISDAEEKLNLDFDQLPQRVGNYVYFETKDDAQAYIKTMIGM